MLVVKFPVNGLKDKTSILDDNSLDLKSGSNKSRLKIKSYKEKFSLHEICLSSAPNPK